MIILKKYQGCPRKHIPKSLRFPWLLSETACSSQCPSSSLTTAQIEIATLTPNLQAAMGTDHRLQLGILPISTILTMCSAIPIATCFKFFPGNDFGGGEVGLYQPKHPTALGLGLK